MERASGRLWQLSTYDWTGRANLGIPTQSYHDINRHTPGSPRGFSALVSRLAFVLFLLRDAGFGFHMLSLVVVRARRRAHDHDRIEKCRERLMHDLLCRRGQPVKETPSMGKWKPRRSYSGGGGTLRTTCDCRQCTFLPN